MCGIIGVWSDSSDKCLELLIRGVHYNKRRGKDSVAALLINPATGQVYREQITEKPRDSDYVAMHKAFKEKTHDVGAVVGLGQSRYMTEGNVGPENIQPLRIGTTHISHNGQIDVDSIRGNLTYTSDSTATTDTRPLGELLVQKLNETGNKWEAVEYLMRNVSGAFSCIVWDGKEMYAFRDPLGFRPLRYGINKNTIVVNSEDGLFKQLDDGLSYDIHNVTPGGMIVLHPNGQVESKQLVSGVIAKSCFFELIYFSDSYSRPDTFYSDGPGSRMTNQMIRHDIVNHFVDFYGNVFRGERVVSVPRSGNSYSQALSLRLGIISSDDMRKKTDIIKHEEAEDRNFLKLLGERTLNFSYDWDSLVRMIVDSTEDSIMRGDASTRYAYDANRMGVRELWINVFSPANLFSCIYGVATPTDQELIAHALVEDGTISYDRSRGVSYDVNAVNKGVANILRKNVLKRYGMKIDNVYVRYPPLEEFKTWLPGDDYCFACIDGLYPTRN